VNVPKINTHLMWEFISKTPWSSNDTLFQKPILPQPHPNPIPPLLRWWNNMPHILLTKANEFTWMRCHYKVQFNLDMKPFFIKVMHFNKLPLLFKVLTNVVWVPTWVTMNNCWLGYVKIGSKFKLIFNMKIGIKIEIYFLKNQI